MFSRAVNILGTKVTGWLGKQNDTPHLVQLLLFFWDPADPA